MNEEYVLQLSQSKKHALINVEVFMSIGLVK